MGPRAGLGRSGQVWAGMENFGTTGTDFRKKIMVKI